MNKKIAKGQIHNQETKWGKPMVWCAIIGILISVRGLQVPGRYPGQCHEVGETNV